MNRKYIPQHSDIASHIWTRVRKEQRDYQEIYKDILSEIIEVNQDLIKMREANYLERCKKMRPLVGEFYIKIDGTYDRFTHDWNSDDGWDNTIQTGGLRGSYFMTDSGHFSYSGGLDSGTSIKNFELTDEWKDGSVWSFDRGNVQANNGMRYTIKFRVWKQTKE